MTEYISDHGYRRPGRAGRSAETNRGGAPVDGDHLLIMHLLYVRTPNRGGSEAESRNGYASLDSLREISRLPAWRVWELIEDLQELDLVDCIWDSRAARAPAPAGTGSGETSGDLRFLRCTQAGLTAEGRSYPPLLEYHRLREQRRREAMSPATGRTRQRQTQPRRRYPVGRPQWTRQPSRGYQVYRPRVQAARRLAYLVCALCVLILAAVLILVF